ncbi:MAG: hypothetical protein FWB97_08840 [Oscillospiraceae bacterium]|nr:hypothetical protein [Oscillospiraceae bacterium]
MNENKESKEKWEMNDKRTKSCAALDKVMERLIILGVQKMHILKFRNVRMTAMRQFAKEGKKLGTNRKMSAKISTNRMIQRRKKFRNSLKTQPNFRAFNSLKRLDCLEWNYLLISNG